MRAIVQVLCLVAACSAVPSKDPLEGFSSRSIQIRIAGGEDAKIAQFPHQVAVQTHRLSQENYDTTTFCGGSLISDQYVLTAAHCLDGGFKVDVFLGATNLTGRWTRLVANREDMIVHEMYDATLIRNDIALIKLPQKVQLNALVQVINLPRLSQKDTKFEMMVGWILGWGRQGDTGRKALPSTNLKYARRWILPNDHCTHHYPDYEGNTQMCVDGSHGVSACPGDSGGPVFVEDTDGRRTVVGVASYERFEGCEKGFPVVYTRVASYLDWISHRTGINLEN